MTGVTQKDLYELVNSRFDRLEDKFGQKFQDIEKRVDVLEDFKGRSLGVLSIVTVIASAAFSWAWNKLTQNS